MIALKEQPIFIGCGANSRPRYNFGKDFTFETLNNITKETKYKTYISFDNMYNLQNTSNVKFIPQTTKFYHNGIDFGKYLYEKIKHENV